MTDQLLEFKKIIRSRNNSEQRKPDKQTRKLLLYLFTSTRGGFTRLRIIMNLLDQPYNTHQLAQALDLDYKAVQHHMKVLEKITLYLKSVRNMVQYFICQTFLKFILLLLMKQLTN